MPELPEVENLRRSLEPWLVGCRIVDVELCRRDVVNLPARHPRNVHGYRAALGVGGCVAELRRHGKQMMVALDDRRAFVIQLGMTGGVTLEQGPPPTGMEGKHRHIIWRVETTLQWPIVHETTRHMSPRRRERGDSDPLPRFVFRDPRRFGSVNGGQSISDIERTWSKLGQDALAITDDCLEIVVRGSNRPIKSLLLDQAMIAGVGNIYADESLFESRLHPERAARSLVPSECAALARALRRVLTAAIDRGGSTLRDYRDAFGKPGAARQTHQAYGRAGLPCVRCGTALLGTRLQGRATVHCPTCQDLSTGPTQPRTRSIRRLSTRLGR